MVQDVRYRSNERWYQELVSRVDNAFSSRADDLFGLRHALRVEAGAVDLILGKTRDFELSNSDVVVLSAAALLHDIGFSRMSATWSDDGYEHVRVGVQMVPDLLRELPVVEVTQLVPRVLELIQGHDTSTYAYPSRGREGSVVQISRDKPSAVEGLSLSCLREADGLEHVGPECFDRSVKEWLKRGIPIGNPPPTGGYVWSWGYSVVSNARLTAKRAVIDSLSTHGQRAALAAYNRIEQTLAELCRGCGAIYESEISPPEWRNDSLRRLANLPRQIELLNCTPWEEFTQVAKSVTLQADRGVYPYQNARLETRLVSRTDVSPMALYALEEKINLAIELHDLFMVGYAVSTFDMLGLARVRLDGSDEWTIAPPILEVLPEDGREGTFPAVGLVDGMHRWSGAHRIGLDRVRSVVIRDVTVPLVPLPVTWEDVRIYPPGYYPNNDAEKRRYRYDAYEDFPRGEYGVTTPVTASNYRYLFYRDLAPLGSTGVRKTGDKTDD